MQASSWEELRRTARQTERELDGRLVAYANASSISSINASSADGRIGVSKTMEVEIESLLSSVSLGGCNHLDYSTISLVSL